MNSSEENIEDSPYCTECGACGHEGCCSPVICKFKGKCDYAEYYLVDLKCSYQSWEIFMNTVYEELPEEFKKKVDSIWDEMYDKWFNKKGE